MTRSFFLTVLIPAILATIASAAPAQRPPPIHPSSLRANMFDDNNNNNNNNNNNWLVDNNDGGDFIPLEAFPAITDFDEFMGNGGRQPAMHNGVDSDLEMEIERNTRNINNWNTRNTNTNNNRNNRNTDDRSIVAVQGNSDDDSDDESEWRRRAATGRLRGRPNVDSEMEEEMPSSGNRRDPTQTSSLRRAKSA